jgi:hypothetical protein
MGRGKQAFVLASGGVAMSTNDAVDGSSTGA